MEVSVFVPAHITGFFSTYNDKNPLKKGSCGAGVLIDKGVVTTVKIKRKSLNNEKKLETPVAITINRKIDTKNEIISRKTISLFKKELSLDLNYDIAINHDIQVPIGAGFGTSASCALGTAIGLSKILKPHLRIIKACQIAHIAEINLGSGLGDVLSQTSKGIVIRESPGAPGIGKVKNIIPGEINNNSYLKDITQEDTCSEICLLSKTFGKIETSSIIQNPAEIKNINKIGLLMQKKIVKTPSIENFMECSYEFGKKTGLMNSKVSAIVEDLKKYTIGSSMAMLGNTVFALSKKEDIHNIEDINEFTVFNIYNEGIKINNQSIN